MKRTSFVVHALLTEDERQFIREMQAIYQFYVIINQNRKDHTTDFILQSDKIKELIVNSFILGGVLSEIFKRRGLSGLPKMAEKHYFSDPAQNPI